MKSIGIVRRLDQLGRVVIPMELRKTRNIAVDDPLEIFVQGENIIFRKYVPECIFCGGEKGITVHKGKNICSSCRSCLKKMR